MPRRTLFRAEGGSCGVTDCNRPAPLKKEPYRNPPLRDADSKKQKNSDSAFRSLAAAGGEAGKHHTHGNSAQTLPTRRGRRSAEAVRSKKIRRTEVRRRIGILNPGIDPGPKRYSALVEPLVDDPVLVPAAVAEEIGASHRGVIPFVLRQALAAAGDILAGRGGEQAAQSVERRAGAGCSAS